MLKQKKIFISVGIGFALLIVSVMAYLFFHKPVTPPRSLLIYTSRPSREVTTNLIVDTDTNEKWEVGKGLAAWRWSPSGKYLVLHTLSPLPLQIWISNYDGSNLVKVFDNKNYPHLEIKDFDWLDDEIILVNVINKQENIAYIYTLDINNQSFEQILKAGSFVKISSTEMLWIQWTNKYELANLDNKVIPLPDYLQDYYFSPINNKMAYSCSGKYKFSSLCTTDVSISGINDDRTIAENAFLNSYGGAWWSQDGKYIGIAYSPEETKISKFKAIDTSNGSIIYDWAFPTTTTLNFWSPRNDKIIDWNGLLLDLKTGQVNNFFEQIHETTPSYVVDWRMIEVP